MENVKANILGCRYEQGVLHKFYFRQSQNILKAIVNPGANLYLKPNDIISHRPTLFGYHEPHLENLFRQVSKTHHDVLLDIGANIGLTSVLVGDDFAEIHCVEPNRTLTKILDVNLELNGLIDRATIHPVGLGLEDKTEELIIPRMNFGGGLVAKGNAYSGQNDNVERDNLEYMVRDIDIRGAESWFAGLFKANRHWRNGVVKVDVEGFELPIFAALLKTLPQDMSVIVVMENFLNWIEFGDFLSDRHDLSWFGVYKEKRFLKSIPFKLLGMSSYYVQAVRDIDPDKNAPHDIVVLIHPKT